MWGQILGGLAQNAMARTEAYNKARAAQDDQIDPNEMAKKQLKARQEAYSALIGRGKEQMGQGEQQFLTESGQPLAELTAAKQAALAGGGEAIQQAGREMATQNALGGVRGGQATLLQNRGMGQMATEQQRNLDNMALDEANRRREMRGQYFGNKARAGQTANLASPTF